MSDDAAAKIKLWIQVSNGDSSYTQIECSGSTTQTVYGSSVHWVLKPGTYHIKATGPGYDDAKETVGLLSAYTC